MTGFLKKIILLGYCAGAIFIARAQVKFTASISPGEIGKNEYAVLRLEVQNAENVEQISPPPLKDFIIVSGPNQESGMSNVNGVVKQYLALSYVLQPRRIGNLDVGTSTAKISGKTFKSDRLRLSVKKAAGPGAAPGNPVAMGGISLLDRFDEPEPVEDVKDYILKKDESVQEKVESNMHLRLQTSKSSCYVGEPIVATYKLYTRLKSESKLSKTPSFNGFSVIEIQRPEETEYAREKLNGREYHVYTIRKAQLYPLQDGPVELESATLDNVVRFLKPGAAAGSQEMMYRFLNGFAVSPDAVATETVSLSSKPVSVTVKPLPEKGKPTGFKGAVGKFTIDANLEKNSFANNETGKLTVTIRGDGNLQLVTAPEISWPAGIETFEPKASEELVHTSVPVSGEKTFEFPFAVDKPGEYVLPAIDFSYFDPSTVSYKILQVPSRKFTVTRGLPRPAYPTTALMTKQSVGFSKMLFNNRGWIVGGIALLMFSGVIAWLRTERKTNAAALAKAGSAPAIDAAPAEVPGYFREPVSFNLRSPLNKSEDCLNNTDCAQFYSLLYAEMKEWLGAKFSLAKDEVNVKTIAVAMDKAGIDNDVVLQLQQLLQEIEWQLYTPFERGEEMALIFSRSKSILQSIDSYETAIL